MGKGRAPRSVSPISSSVRASSRRRSRIPPELGSLGVSQNRISEIGGLFLLYLADALPCDTVLHAQFLQCLQIFRPALAFGDIGEDLILVILQ